MLLSQFVTGSAVTLHTVGRGRHSRCTLLMERVYTVLLPFLSYILWSFFSHFQVLHLPCFHLRNSFPSVYEKVVTCLPAFELRGLHWLP